jgi:hypothetical protein
MEQRSKNSIIDGEKLAAPNRSGVFGRQGPEVQIFSLRPAKPPFLRGYRQCSLTQSASITIQSSAAAITF